MSVCPQCGYPKYLHERDKMAARSSLPKVADSPARICALEDVPEIDQEERRHRRVDHKEYRKRAYAHEQLRLLRFDDDLE